MFNYFKLFYFSFSYIKLHLMKKEMLSWQLAEISTSRTVTSNMELICQTVVVNFWPDCAH